MGIFKEIILGLPKPNGDGAKDLARNHGDWLVKALVPVGLAFAIWFSGKDGPGAVKPGTIAVVPNSVAPRYAQGAAFIEPVHLTGEMCGVVSTGAPNVFRVLQNLLESKDISMDQINTSSLSVELEDHSLNAIPDGTPRGPFSYDDFNTGEVTTGYGDKACFVDVSVQNDH